MALELPLCAVVDVCEHILSHVLDVLRGASLFLGEAQSVQRAAHAIATYGVHVLDG
jgi:hypothetical protein